MNTLHISVDSANAVMSLIGGVLALLASLVALVVALLPREDALGTARRAAIATINFLPTASV